MNAEWTGRCCATFESVLLPSLLFSAEDPGYCPIAREVFTALHAASVRVDESASQIWHMKSHAINLRKESRPLLAFSLNTPLWRWFLR